MDFFGIPFDENALKNTKKNAMKKLVNEKIRDASHSSLLEDRKGKLCNLEADYQLKEYLVTEKLSIEQKQFLFNLRTRMVFVKCNYRNKYQGNLQCCLCDFQSEDSQEHLLVCPPLLKEIDIDVTVEYMDIFGSIEKQINAARYFFKIMSVRKLKLKETEISHGRNHVHCI